MAARGGAPVGASRVGVGHASYEECDELGHDRGAARRRPCARSRELDEQGYVPDRIVLDGNHDYLRMPAQASPP